MKIGVIIGVVVGLIVVHPQAHAQENGVKRVGYEILQIKSFNEIIAWQRVDIWSFDESTSMAYVTRT